MTTIRSALIIKIGAIGDVVMALPLARELSAQGCTQITWLSGKEIAPILGLAPEITESITLDERALFGESKLKAALEVFKTWWHLRSLAVDSVYLLHGDSRYRLLVPPWLRSKIRAVRVGSRRHHTFDYARLAFPAKEDRELDFAPYTLPVAAKREARVCLFPGGAKNTMRDNPLRRWPLHHYVALCERLLAQGFRVSILGGPSDLWIEPSFSHLREKVDWQVGTLKLDETVDYLRRSQLAISHDTGPIHLSSLADCPVISIFGPTNSEWFAPLNFKHLVLERSPKLPCQPCYDGKDFGSCTNNICINTIAPEVVTAKALSALELS